MYCFVAHYADKYDQGEIYREIRINQEDFTEEKEIYLHAMSEAYTLKQDDEELVSLTCLSVLQE